MHNVTCRVRHINRTTQILNWDANVQPNVFITDIRVNYDTNVSYIAIITDSHSQLKVKTYYKYATVYRPNLVSFSESICDMLSNAKKSHILNSVVTEKYLKQSNLLKPCPKSVKNINKLPNCCCCQFHFFKGKFVHQGRDL